MFIPSGILLQANHPLPLKAIASGMYLILGAYEDECPRPESS